MKNSKEQTPEVSSAKEKKRSRSVSGRFVRRDSMETQNETNDEFFPSSQVRKQRVPRKRSSKLSDWCFISPHFVPKPSGNQVKQQVK